MYALCNFQFVVSNPVTFKAPLIDGSWCCYAKITVLRRFFLEQKVFLYRTQLSIPKSYSAALAKDKQFALCNC